ncbi:hypothetical protein M0G74_11720 [Microbulbifer sp. CAU 1566]|uniref:hypothetical protein n=1 Tax=Microbulbifer sp. CAU 1566 TaxID=2933269 RepID=UPI0020029FD8|nr:hypothetical protein [Microbulbifer sp. CAU 1566]MCK7597941.1 hypothetical protein [Microbulbifer sp. CAU 1566]
MQLFKGVMAIGLFVISSSLLANECLVSTTPRALFSGLEQVTDEKFAPDRGEYSATLKDGSSITARFDLCGLGLKASYLIEHKNDGLPDYISFLLLNVMPPDSAADSIASKVAAHTEDDFRGGVTLPGSNGDHWVQVKDFPSPVYEAVIHYRWIPPEH